MTSLDQQNGSDLKKVFWVYGVLLSSVLLAIYGAMIYSANATGEQIMMVVLALYTIWILFSIWQSATYAEPKWGLMARMLTVAWALNMGMILVFRELDLASRFF